jgi:hypothetical protein
MIENLLDIGGAVAFWSLAEWTSRHLLLEGFEQLGLSRFVPALRAAPAALRDALAEVLGGPRILVRPLARRDGFTVVREQRGDEGNTYQQELLACLDGSNGSASIRFLPQDDRAVRVQEAYQRQRGRLHGSQVSNVLVDLIETLGGTRLRPNGAIYWLPGNLVGDWQPIAQAVEKAAEDKPSRLYLLRHRMDADAVRAVTDAIIAEIQLEAARIHDEEMTGELGERALEHRREQASSLRQKVLRYEELLDVGLSNLHEAVDRADQAAAAAVLLVSAQGSSPMAAQAG